MARVRSLRKLGPGEKLPVLPRETFNTIIDLRTLQSRTRFNAGNGPRPPAAALRQSVAILVRNDSGEDVDRFGVLGIDQPIVLPDENEEEFAATIAMACVAPSGASSSGPSHAGRFVITTEPIADGETGRAIIAGVSWCRLENASAQGGFADIIDGNTEQLRVTGAGSAQILWRDASSSGGWALVRLGGVGRTIPVALEQDGGSAGDTSNYCSFTYTVKDIAGETTLAEGVELTGMGQRVLKSAMTPATYGLAFVDADGVVQLLWCDEVFADQKNCEGESSS